MRNLFNWTDFLNESLDLKIKDYNYDEGLDTILKICQYSRIKLMQNHLLKELTEDEMAAWQEKGMPTEFLSPDGNSAFNRIGIMNFYLDGFPFRLVDSSVSYIKYILNEKDVIVSNIHKEQNRVVRIFITKNGSHDSNPPSLNMSTSNAKNIFTNILHINMTNDIEVNDLMAAIDEKRPEIEKLIKNPSFTKVYGAHTFEIGKQEVLDRINIIYKIAQWAKDNGHDKLILT